MSHKNNTRLTEFDALKLFCIFCVILGHCLMHLQNYQFVIFDNPLYCAICSFHMPLFMMISGFFGCRILNINFKDFILKKSRQLLLPAAAFGVLFCISWIYIGGGTQPVKTWIICYWFLKSAFICALLYYIAIHSPNPSVALIVTLILSQFCFAYQVNNMYPCFLLGAFINRHYDWIKAKAVHVLIISAAVYIVLLTQWTTEMAQTPLMRIHRFIHMAPDAAITIAGTHMYKLVMGMAGSIMFLSIFIIGQKLFSPNRTTNTICKWGQYTLGIYLLQAIIVEHIMMRTLDFSNLSYPIFNFAVAPIISVIVLILCVGIINLIHRSRLTSLLILGEQPR